MGVAHARVAPPTVAHVASDRLGAPPPAAVGISHHLPRDVGASRGGVLPAMSAGSQPPDAPRLPPPRPPALYSKRGPRRAACRVVGLANLSASRQDRRASQ
eukprot:6605883-Prymnesium_polylepis.1